MVKSIVIIVCPTDAAMALFVLFFVRMVTGRNIKTNGMNERIIECTMVVNRIYIGFSAITDSSK